MARKIANRVAVAVRNSNQHVKTLAKAVNKVNHATGGILLNNPYANTIVPVANRASSALSYFDSLLNDFVPVHNQLNGASSAGVAYGMEVRRSKPKFTNSQGMITITHKELLGEVDMATGISVSPTFANGASIYSVNARNASAFPWLSTIAGNYDFFRFRRARLVYVPLVSTATAGRVMMGYDPDAADALSMDRQGLSNYNCSTEGSAWSVLSLDCDLPQLTKWYNTDSPTSTFDTSLGNQGQFFTACWAGSSTAACGELYVVYEVQLKDPQPSLYNLAQAFGSGSNVSTQFTANDPAIISSTSTSVLVTFVATGSYHITVYAAATGAATPTFTGALTLVGSKFATNGTNTSIVDAFVNVTGLGFSTVAGVISSSATVTFPTLTALGTYTVYIVRTPTFPTLYNF